MNTSTEPERVYESRHVEIGVGELKQDDYNVNWGRVTGKPKRGTKWIYFTAEQAGRESEVKLLLGTTVTVQRKFETEESQRAQEEHWRSERIEKFLAEWEPTRFAQLEKFTVKFTEWDGLHYDNLQQLIHADAEDRVTGAMVQTLKHRAEQPDFKGYTAEADAYLETLKTRLAANFRGLSHSTSMTSNLLDQALWEAMANLATNKYLWLG